MLPNLYLQWKIETVVLYPYGEFMQWYNNPQLKNAHLVAAVVSKPTHGAAPGTELPGYSCPRRQQGLLRDLFPLLFRLL